jgi:hypothetical protein
VKRLRLLRHPDRAGDRDRLERAHRQEQKRLADARREHDRVSNQWPVVLQYAAALTAHRERNHFAESINLLFRGGNQ